ncbi:hypothetical protein SAMN02745824_1361 [Parasphingorhabdus marina DSM 22363]|uniref:Uncharacterized protein n=1 Tax=Parasphingorhabdus marina DSM 22363 TaxID=1123272 RepID=A0A1N6D0F6_9SPHN|nr:hypothetical protein [Parasphingorhabdus marina]SIN64217.1 hypothetical protein SAMN02745824_1361 [Parasphingorhabdus marina DSM 22363]
MSKIRKYSGLPLSALALAVTTIAGASPALAQADQFNALFDKKSSETRELERRGDQARDQRRNNRQAANPDFNGREYRQHVGDLAANSDLQELEQRGYDARRGRPGHQIEDVNDLTPTERQQLDRRGRDAQVAHGARQGYQNNGHPSAQRNTNRHQRGQARTPRGTDFRGPAYRKHAGRLAGTGNLEQLEQRGYDARRARPGHQFRDEYDYTPNERRQLQRQGRQAQITHGQRQGYRPTAAGTTAGTRQYQRQARYGNNGYPGAGRAPVRGQGARNMSRTSRIKSTARTGFAATSVSNRVSAVDMGTEAFGGHSTGIGEYGVDMTFGQAQTFANGGDPVIAAGRATERFGHNLYGAARGVGDSIRDPRRIPGNVNRAVTGAARAGVGAVQYVGEKTVKTTRDGARFMTDPNYAAKQVNYGAKRVGKTVSNIGKSTCKGFSTLFGLSKRKCK